jgi:hypothetical protein
MALFVNLPASALSSPHLLGTYFADERRTDALI